MQQDGSHSGVQWNYLFAFLAKAYLASKYDFYSILPSVLCVGGIHCLENNCFPWVVYSEPRWLPHWSSSRKMMTHLSISSSHEHYWVVTDHQIDPVLGVSLTVTAELRQGPYLSFCIPEKTQSSHSHSKLHEEMEWNN